MLSLGRIVISDLVVADLFMHSLPGMILLYLAVSFFTLKVFLGKFILPNGKINLSYLLVVGVIIIVSDAVDVIVVIIVALTSSMINMYYCNSGIIHCNKYSFQNCSP